MERSTASRERTSSTTRRAAWQVLMVLVALAVTAIPFVLIRRDFGLLGHGTDVTLHTILRFFALLGITLLFLQIVTGAFRPLLTKVVRPRMVQHFHTGFGLAGLAFVVCHFALLIPSIGEHWRMVNHGFFVLGPIVLFLLLLTISTALVRRRLLPSIWMKLHVLNYVVFTVGTIHALGIGSQTRTPAARIIMAVFLAVVVSAFAYRASSPRWRARFQPASARVRVGR